MQSLPRAPLAFFWHFIKPYTLHLLYLVIAVTVIAACRTLLPFEIKTIIDHITQDPTNTTIPWQPIIIYIALAELTNIAFRCFDGIVTKIMPDIRSQVRNSCYTYLLHHSYRYMQDHLAGSLGNKVLDMGQTVIQAIEMAFIPFLSTTLTIIISIILMWYIYPTIAIIFALWSLCFLAISIIGTPMASHLSHQFSSARSEYMGRLIDSVTNILSVKLFANQTYEYNYIQTSQQSFVKANRKLNWYVIKIRWILGFSITLFSGFMLYYIAHAWQQQLISIGSIAFILTISLSTGYHLFEVASRMLDFFQIIGTFKQSLSILNATHEVADATNAQPLHVHEGKIQAHNIHFAYTHHAPLFSNLNLTINPGTKIGLVGFSGSGKSTFVHLLLRFYNITSGSITIDNQNIANVTQDSLRHAISVIAQDTSLFHRSLMENIRYGNIHATDAQVIEASKQAHCHEFISQLEEGYHTLVGEHGVKLSGGQRQRIAIARAILKNAPIIILDEATSALDSITEKYIYDSLNQLTQNRTTIIIAHRLSTLLQMDRIIVFNQGNIIEDGTHTELLAQQGHYASMWKMQAEGFLPETEMK